ncbi:TPA: MFS transporter [Legionella pneumophila]|uniref:MFS transporter n=1 Tax=Legionella sp. PATHC039 TaxID=2992042 RepID=UPI001A1B3790|nr:MFS transporter [Legionella sp. PATHC039]HAT8859181.1 MFS transporter [Legionella pneumophila subsp. pneumophila]HEH5972706.1 MFS transporter [Legionella pneumophila]MCW8396343.1 MFS transporter [Legionella sp. PATHC039]HAT9650999.1 MFS transporter [Legionella pneumophila subsp. pneumophila]HAT9920087.1 MFS transporter [Legionella pneumophila subsp. pneumophila]
MLKQGTTKILLPHLMLFLVSLNSSIIPPLIGPLFIEAQGLFPNTPQSFRINMYSQVMGVYFIGVIVGSYLCGKLADRIGNKKTLLLCLFGALLGNILCLWSLWVISFILFFAGRIIDGLMAGRRAVILSMISYTTPDKLQSFRYSETTNAAGLLVGPALCGFLINYHAPVPLYYYSWPFLIMFALGVFNLIVLPKISNKPQNSTAKQSSFNLVMSLRNPVILTHAMLSFVWGLYYISILPFGVVKHQLGVATVGILFTAMVLFYIAFLTITQYLTVRGYKLFQNNNFAILLLIIGLFSLATFGIYWQLFLFSNLLIVLSFSLINPAYLNLIVNISEDNNRGTFIGLHNGITGLAIAVAALISGVLFNLSLSLPFFVAAGIAFLVVPLSTGRL